MTFKDYATAAAMRDVITKIAEEVVTRMRPEFMIGEIYSFDNSGTAQVRLAGHSDSELLQVRFAKDKQPFSSVENPITGTADVVRIAGRPGSWFILDFVRGSPAVGIPTGGMIPYGGATAPLDFLMCNGAFVLIEDYPALFSVIKHNHNRVGGVITDPGDGTFKLPDLIYRQVIGASDFDVHADYSVGQSDALSLSNRITHWDHTHAHVIPPANMNLETNTATGGGGNRITNGETHSHGGSTETSATVGTTEPRHAYQSEFWIIKT